MDRKIASLVAVAATASLLSFAVARSLNAEAATAAASDWIGVGVASPSSNMEAPSAFFLNTTTRRVVMCAASQQRCFYVGQLP
jgi:hypothetical protein